MEEQQYKRILFDEETLQARIRALGEQISRDYAGKELVLVSILKGTLYFLADLSRAITLPLELDFMAIGLYADTAGQSGVVRITKDLDLDITGKHVLVIEDIIRTGLTTGYLVQNLRARKPASIGVCTLLVNPAQQLINVPISYYGFEVPHTWLVGYGMDIREKGRNLPFIAEAEKK